MRVHLRGIPLKTLDHMRHALDRLDEVVARAVKRVPESVACYRNACVAAPMIALVPTGLVHAPDAADI